MIGMGTSLFTRSVARARGKVFWAGLLRVSGVLFLAKRWVRRRGTIVLTFHRVLGDVEFQQTASLHGMVVRKQSFENFLKYAVEEYEFVDLSREPEWRPCARTKLVVTFDDGWSDNATIAEPIARKH